MFDSAQTSESITSIVCPSFPAEEINM